MRLPPATALFIVLAIAAALPRLVACTDEPAVQRWTIAPHEVSCGESAQPRTCLLGTDPHGVEHVLDAGIEGLTWQWGVHYDLEVRVESAAADDATPRLILERIITAAPVAHDTRFTLELAPPWLEGDPQSGFRLYDSRGIECATPEPCEALAQALERDAPVELTLRYPDGDGGALVLEAVARPIAEGRSP